MPCAPLSASPRRSSSSSPRPDRRSVLRFVLVTAELVEVLQQRLEATAAGAGMQVDAADLLDQLLQRLELLETQQEWVVLHQLRGIEQRARRRSLLLPPDEVGL